MSIILDSREEMTILAGYVDKLESEEPELLPLGILFPINTILFIYNTFLLRFWSRNGSRNERISPRKAVVQVH
jgi:hypothetical protein